jgi:hypothetical protein
MTIVSSRGVSVVAFKQSGIVERRDPREDDDQNLGLLNHADGADCRRAGPLGRPCARRGVTAFPAHERSCPPGMQPIERIMSLCRGVRRCARAIRDSSRLQVTVLLSTEVLIRVKTHGEELGKFFKASNVIP